ncbi:hypothetical protein G6731_00050 [Polynucleobacter paneuropaeus]|uniref:Uncharacterized protein n=1 Tax=Polynucleobacter paneuropaeus TaxID=2527775 RepID=A0A9Q2WHF5_9BURK|nr:hypothetical protein [Polynucleobacter paneuropaeus]
MGNMVSIDYNNAGLGDLMHQIDYAYSVANHFGLDFVMEDYICSLFGEGSGIDYTHEMGWNLFPGYSNKKDNFVVVDSDKVMTHDFANKFTKIKFIYHTDHYQNIKRIPFPYSTFFEKKHGTIELKKKHCVIQLRMGELRTYLTKRGNFNPTVRQFTDVEGRSNWKFDDLRMLISDLKERGYSIDVITDGIDAGIKSILWWSKSIDNDYGLSNKEIAALVEDAGLSEIDEIKAICENVYVNENFIDTVKRIMSAELLVQTNSIFLPLIFFNLMNIQVSRLVKYDDFVAGKKLL